MDFDEVGNVPATMRKDLAAAHQLAAEQHDLPYFKEILKNFMEAREAERAAKEAAKAEKKAKKAAAKKEKKTPKVVEDDEEEDIDMADAPGEVDSEAPGLAEAEPSKSKKRKSKHIAGDVSYCLHPFQPMLNLLRPPSPIPSRSLDPILN
jgi:hypothetical protein